MTNKSKLAFDLLEQEMEVICKEEQVRFTGGSGGYTWEEIVDAIQRGDLSQFSDGTYVNSGGVFTYYGRGDVYNYVNSNYGYLSSGGYIDQTWGNGTGGYSTDVINPMITQSRTDCVFQCFAQIASYYGNFSFTLNSMMSKYNSIYSGSISSSYISSATSGVDLGLFKHFSDQYFNRSPVSTVGELGSFIQGNDNWAIGVIRKYSADGTSSSLHAVVLTGIDGNGEYKYSDPQNEGKTGFVSQNDLVDFIAITGLCN